MNRTQPIRSQLKLHLTRLHMELLEDRLQPGSLLTGSVDFSWLEGLLPRPRSAVPEISTIPALTKLDNDEINIQIVPASPASNPTPAVRATPETKTPTESTPLVDLAHTGAPPIRSAVVTPDSGGTLAKRTLVATPALHAPQSARSIGTAAVSAVRLQDAHSTPAVPQVMSTPDDVKASAATVPADNSLIRPFPKDAIKAEPCDGGGSRANFFNSYDGLAAADSFLAVGSGKDGLIGDSFAVGFQGLSGRGVHYSPTGACLFSATIADPFGLGQAVVAKDIAVNKDTILGNNLYVVGTIGADAHAFLLRFSPTFALVGGVIISAAPGTTISLDGVAVSPVSGTADVFATGYYNDPGVAAYDVIRALRFDATVTTPAYNVNIVFATASRGWTIDADRGNISFIGGYLINTVPVQNALRLSLTATGAINPGWGGGFTTGSATPVNDPRNGWTGVDLLPGASAVGGLYLTGSVVDGGNPGAVNQHLRRANPLTGLTVGTGFIYTGGAGIDLAGEDIVVDRQGLVYTAGYTGTAANRDAIYIQWTNLLAFAVSDTLGGAASQDLGRGIDLELTQPAPNVYMVGSTDTPAASMSPAPSGCQTVLGGLTDGFAAYGSQPAPF